MSRENVEIVREHIEAFRQDDAPRSLSCVDPYVVVDRSRIGTVDSMWPTDTERSSKRCVVRWERSRNTPCGGAAYRPRVRRDTPVVTESGRGKGSGVPVRRSFAYLYTLIDGQIARITQFPSEEQALEAAGPS